MIGGERAKLILGYDEEGKFKIDRVQAELLGLIESEQRWILTKPGIPDFQKISADIMWIEFNEDRTYKSKHKEPAVGLSLLMSPFNQYFTWQTTPITHIKESKENYWLFETENSTYLLRKLEEDDKDYALNSLEAQESI
jgi:hypothetical protein